MHAEAASRGLGFDSERSAAQSLASAIRFGHRFENLAPSPSPIPGAPIQRISNWRRRLYGGLATVGGAAAAVGGVALGATAAAAGTLTAGPALLAGGLVAGGAIAAYHGVQALRRPRPAAHNPVNLPATEIRDRQDKPDRLKGTYRQGGQEHPLSAHHKLPFNSIRNTANLAISGSALTGTGPEARESLEAWTRRDHEGSIGPAGVEWTDHNIFLGPAPEARAHDPGGEGVDTHFTQSGTVTPRSELALDVAHAGGIHRLDPEELRRRLEALPSRHHSDYDPAEWRNTPEGLRQRGEPADWHTRSLADKRSYARARRAAKNAEIEAARNRPKRNKKKRN